MARSRDFCLALGALVLVACGSDDEASGSKGPPKVEGDPFVFAQAPRSCAFACPPVAELCDEVNEPYACPSLADWDQIPHADTCESWDGKQPSPVTGQCTASAPSGDAAKYAGPDPDFAGGFVLPDGRPTRPAGSFYVFTEPDLEAGLTTGILPIPGTSYVLTLDTGSARHAVRAVDTDQIGQGNPVTSYVHLQGGEYLNSSAAFVAPDRVLAATLSGVVQAFRFDAATGVLTRDDANNITLPKDYMAAGVAATPDGTRLVVSPTFGGGVLVYDLTSGVQGTLLADLDVGSGETFGAYVDPTGTRAYVSMWARDRVEEIELDPAAGPALGRSFEVDKNPQGIVFLDDRWMVVTNDLGETLSIIDRVGGTVSSVPIDYEPGLRGLDPSALGYDATRARLYVTLSGINALAAYDVDLAASPPRISIAGRLPAGWWPSGVVVHDDGDLTVTTMRGYGAGPVTDVSPSGKSPQERGQRGGVQHIAVPTADQLTAGEGLVAAAVRLDQLDGTPRIECPAGADDFPIPATNTEGPSPKIEHVFYVIRENKTFDGVLGDLAGVEGDASLTMKPTSEEMEQLWPNIRELARVFTHSDNAYTDADASIQGHAWNTYARSTDYCERSWSSDARTVPGCGISELSKPEEGSLFDWLGENDVRYDLMGEIVGNPRVLPEPNPVDLAYPGGPFQSIGHPDIDKACHVAGRVRVRCDIAPFVFMTLPNDHGQGLDPRVPTPEVMVAVNDEATGMLVDAISHSPIWKSSLIIITEDDPQQGGDHIDYHRVPLVFASPWVKRGYVSTTHQGVPATHKLFAHIFGIPYPNLLVKNAPLVADIFTSTPDFTPFDYIPRRAPLACGEEATAAERQLSASWDFDHVDDQPGVDAQMMRWMRGRQLTELSPEQLRGIAERKRLQERRAAGELVDDD